MNPMKYMEKTIAEKGYGTSSFKIENLCGYNCIVLYNAKDPQTLFNKLHQQGVHVGLLRTNGIHVDDSIENLKSAVEDL